MWVEPGDVPDAIYLVAGAEDQHRRIAALVVCLTSAANNSRQKTQKGGSIILIGNDCVEKKWSEEDGRYWTMAEYAEMKLSSVVRRSSSVLRPPGAEGLEIVQGERFYGTDAEMEILGGYLEERTNIVDIALVTSPFHVRRAAGRLRRHLDRDVDVLAIKAESIWQDRAPWVVAAELGKMLRDALGLSRAPLLSRRWWVEGI